MKKIYAVLLVALFFFPAAAFAANNESVYLGSGESVPGDFMNAGGTVDIAGQVGGDLMTVGGSISQSGQVDGDTLIAGGSIFVTGSTGGSTRVVGGNVELSGETQKNLTAAGGNLRLGQDAKVDGNAYLAGGMVVVSGEISGNLKAAGGSVLISGKISGNATIYSDSVVVKKGAEISGDLVYYSQNQAVIEEGSIIGGETTFNKTAFGSKKFFGSAAGVMGIWFLIWKVLSALIVLWVFWKLAGRFVLSAAGDFSQALGKKLLTGLIVLIVVPVASLIAMITILGLPLGLSAMALFAVGVYLSYLLGVLLFGKWVLNLLKFNDKEGVFPWYAAVLGLILETIISLIPFVGALFALMLVLWGAGSMVVQYKQSSRPQAPLL